MINFYCTRIWLKTSIQLFLVFSASHLNAQVNLQSGAAEQNFPLITYTNETSELSYHLSLSYWSGNGLKVRDFASNVGTGWSLNTGGYIVREQIGQPDDQEEFICSQPGIHFARYPNGYLYNPNIALGCNQGITRVPMYDIGYFKYKELNKVAADTEQDVFHYEVNGRRGRFVIEQGTPWKIRPLEDTKCRFEFVTEVIPYTRTRISKFIITTEDGVKYYFADKAFEIQTKYVLNRNVYNPFIANFSAEVDHPVYENPPFFSPPPIIDWDNPFHELEENNIYYPYMVVNRWQLSKIENENTGAQISMRYSNVFYREVSRGMNISTQTDHSVYANSATFNSVVAPTPINSYVKKDIVHLKELLSMSSIKQILLPDGEKIDFFYSPHRRLDGDGFADYALEKVSYSKNDDVIKEYHFSYGYLYKNQVISFETANLLGKSERKFLWLCLTGLRKSGNKTDNANNSEPPYNFEYYLNSSGGSPVAIDDIVPARNSLSVDAHDYYNGDNSQIHLFEDPVNLNWLQYTNTLDPYYRTIKNGYAKNGLLKKITFPTGGKLTYFYEQCKTSVLNHSKLPSDILSNGVSVSKIILEDPVDLSKTTSREYKYIKANGTSSKWGDESSIYVEPSFFKFNLERRFIYPGEIKPASYSSIKSPQPFDLAIILVLKGPIDFAYTVVNAIGPIVQNDPDHIENTESQTAVATSVNLRMKNAFPHRYSRTEVHNFTGGQYNGKTVYEFTNNSDAFSNFHNRNGYVLSRNEWPFHSVPREPDWLYGSIKRVTVFNNSNFKISETSNNYDFIQVPISTNISKMSCSCKSYWRKAERLIEWMGGAYTSFITNNQVELDLKPRYYSHVQGHMWLESKTEFLYKDGNPVLKQTTEFSESNLINRTTLKVINPKELIYTINFFPLDFDDLPPGSIVEKMINKGMVHKKIGTVKVKVILAEDYNENEQPIIQKQEMIFAEVVEYKSFAGGDGLIKPWKLHVLKVQEPLVLPFFKIKLPTFVSLGGDDLIYRVKAEYSYSSQGQLQQKLEEGRLTSYTYTEDGAFTTGIAVNSPANDFAYTSFEDNSMGRWDYDDTYINHTEAITGKKTFYLSEVGSSYNSKLIKSNLNDKKTYYITLWVKKASGTLKNVYVNNQSAKEVLYENTSWKLLKYEISNVLNATITGNNVEIDEVRLFPKESIVSTNTYEPGVGITSECDAGNRIIYHEYDALGRVKLLRDENKQVLKTFEYSYFKN